jgi:hypothetical protein
VGQVEALLDRIEGQPSAMQYIAERFEALGYMSWAYRIVNSSGAACHASAPTAHLDPYFSLFLGSGIHAGALGLRKHRPWGLGPGK